MKNKFMVFMLLFAFLVGVVAPDQVKAEDVTEWYNFGEYWIDQGKSLSELPFEYDSSNQYMYCQGDGNKYYIFVYGSDVTDYMHPMNYNNNVFFYYWDNCDGVYVSSDNVSWSEYSGSSGYVNLYKIQECYFYSDFSFKAWNVDILDTKKDYVPYTFDTWCSDAGLNCAASSNESASVIPFFYEPNNYNYIVSKNLTASTTSGVYNLLMIQKGDNSHYPYHFQVGSIEYLGIAGSFSSVNTFTVRTFKYDIDGWKLIRRNDVSELPFDHADFTFDENTVFLYSDTDIYSDRSASSVWKAASTEYYNVDIPEPEISRVPVNPGPGSSVGGQAKPGGLLEFVISLITMVWTELFAVEVPVDGYNISFQQIVIWGAIVGILIWFGTRIFGKK